MPSFIVIIAFICIAVVLTLPALFAFRIAKAVIVYQFKKRGVAHIPRFQKTFGFFAMARPDPKLAAPSLTNPETGHYYEVLNMGPGFDGTPILHVYGAEAARQILSGSDVTDFPKHPATYGPLSDGLLGNGLITSSGEKWRRNRKLLTPLFHMKTQKEMQQMMVLYTQDLLDTIETEGPEKYHLGFDLFGKYTLTQIVMLAFGGLVDINWMLEKQHQLGSAFFEYIKARFMFGASYKYLPVPTVRNIANLRSAIGEQTKSVIKQIKAELAKKKADGSIPADLLSTLLLSKDPATGQSIPEEDILEEAATMLFAGFDTSAVTLCWVMYHLAEDQERQEKLYRGLAKVLGDRDPTLDDITKLPYLRQVIKETLRMYPPATALARYAAHDCYIGKANYFIPKDTPLHVHVQFLHRNPESWTNPHDFIPERWDDDENTTIDTDDTQQAAQGRHPFAYIPFAAGARNCIGKAFANQELSVGVAMLVRKFKITRDATRDIKTSYTPVLTPDQLWLQFKSRE